MPEFVKGLELARCFYWQAVRPLLLEALPGVPHSAGLLGPGSEVLGLDTEMSTDHSWGPRALVFLTPDDLDRHGEAASQALARGLPPTFMGYSTSFADPTSAEPGTRMPEPVSAGPVNHWVEFHSPSAWVEGHLGLPAWDGLDARAWLSVPQQKLLEITAGDVFHDELGLEGFRASLRWYPHDVWLYLLAAGWKRIGQDEHLMGRAGIAGDEVGSGLIAGRIVREIMRLCFLLERRYPPYRKWFGSLFRTLPCGPGLLPTLEDALCARTWRGRETHLCVAVEALAKMHNSLRLTDALDPTVRQFHGRPFRVIGAERFSSALLAAIRDADVLQIARGPLIGDVDQWSDSTDLREAAELRTRFAALYR